MRLRGRNQKGFTLVFATFVMLALVVLIVCVGRTISSSAHKNVHTSAVASAKRLAETGVAKAVGRLTVDPTSYLSPTFQQDEYASPSEVYSSRASTVTYTGTAGYYIVTSASRTVNGKLWTCQLHTYARISNVADYFAAINGPLTILAGANVTGKVYAPQIIFEPVPVGMTTNVYSVEFTTSCSPNPIQASDRIVISTPATGQPVQLAAGAVFPQVLDSDMTRYRFLAHVDDPNPNKRHDECDFTRALYRDGFGVPQIFPPGYTGGQALLDHYANHNVTDNDDHVYYCSGDLTLEGVVHGQVLFVATGDIHISSALVSAPVTSWLPGAGVVSSSTAHQAILLTRGRVIVDKTFTPEGTVPAAIKTERVQALVMAPNGQLLATPYSTAGIRDKLAIEFTGSMILDSSPDITNTFKTRAYIYMNSLNTNPPPYLPALADIMYQFEKISTPSPN